MALGQSEGQKEHRPGTAQRPGGSLVSRPVVTAAFFDLDGTLTAGHVWRGLSQYLRTNRVHLVRYYAFLAGHLAQWLLSKLRLASREEFLRQWVQDMAIFVKGYTWSQSQELFSWITQREITPKLRPPVLEALKWHLEEGHAVVLVSSTFRDLVRQVAHGLKVRYATGTELESAHGRYTGRVSGPLCFGSEKERQVLTYLKREGLAVDFAKSYAYSDSIYDLPLLKLVGHPVAVYPDKLLRRYAQSHGWSIIDSARPRRAG